MVGTLALSGVSANTYAADYSGNTIKITKNVETADDGTMEPNTTFNFSVENGEAGTFESNVVYAGVTDGLKGTSITFTPGTTAEATYTRTGTLTTDVSKFTSPGIYAYTVTEDAVSYEGITKDSSVYTVYVYVENGTSGLVVSNVVAVKNGVKSDLTFTNDYGKNSNTTHDVTVSKKVTGNQGDKNKTFSFTYKVDGASGEKYTVVTSTGSTAITSGTEYTLTLKDGESFTVQGLTASDKVTVTENDYSSDGYTTTIDGDNVSTATKTYSADGSKMAVVNDKETAAPTGIIMNYAPYALMVVLAAGFFFVTRRNRNREEI